MRKVAALLILAAVTYGVFIAGLNVGYDRGRQDERASRACPCDQCDCGPPEGDSHAG